MDSRELGLVLAQQLFGAEDLHYGLWDADLPVTAGNVVEAQRRLRELIFAALPPAPARLLDVGCGTGAMLAELRVRGYAADGLVPAPELARQVRARLAALGAAGEGARLIEARFEDVSERLDQRYDAVIFSESFQYIPMDRALAGAARLLAPNGRVVICDFFKSAAHGDGGPCDGVFGGGHPLADFLPAVARAGLAVERDEDITRRISPSLAVVNDILMHRVRPAAHTLAAYALARRPLLARLVWRLYLRRLWEKASRKYFSGCRAPEVFERYKSYRLVVLRRS